LRIGKSDPHRLKIEAMILLADRAGEVEGRQKESTVVTGVRDQQFPLGHRTIHLIKFAVFCVIYITFGLSL
jgi:hypothetical protein